VTTTAPSAGHARWEELLAQLFHLKGKTAQAGFLAKHPELLKADVVSWLTDSVREQARVNTGRAVMLAEFAVTIARKLGNQVAVAQSLRAMGNALHVSGQNRSAVNHHEKARKIFVELRSTTELARTLSASIQPLILTGQYARAFSAAEQARHIFLAEGNEWRLARLGLNVGNILQRQGRFTEALESYEQAQRYFLTNPRQDPEALAAALHNIAMCLVGLNNFPRALATHKEAREFALEHGMLTLVGQADYNIASLYYFRGEHSRAIEMLRSTCETCRTANDQYHVALCHLDLSEIYLELNQVKQAEEMAQEAAVDFERLGMGYETGKSLANLALAMWQQGRAGLALELFAKAQTIFVNEENHVWSSRINLYQAIIFVEQSRYAEAEHLCLAALKVFQTSKVPHKAILCQLLLAQLRLRTSSPEAARLHCCAALKQLRALQVPALHCQAHHLMGQIHVAAARPNEAYDCYQQARQILEALRSGLNREELKISFMKTGLEIYEGLVELCVERVPGHRDLEEAFEYIEQSKSRSLRDLMFKSGSEFHLTANLDPDLIRKVRDLRAEINWYSHYYEAEQLRKTKISAERLARIQSEIRKRESDLLRVVREMPVVAAESAGLVSPRAAAVEEIRSHLLPGSTLLEYFQIRGRFVAILLKHDLLEIAPVAEASRVNDLLTRLQFQLSKFRLAPEYIRTFGDSLLETTRQHLKDLHDALLGPVRKWLTGDHLVVVPHGILHSLPFQALFDGEQYLIDSFSVSYAPSATVFSLCDDRSSNLAASALVLGVPDEVAPFVLDEARAVAAAIPASELFLGESATTKVLQEKGHQSRFIHIATHGYFRQDDPMFSGIRMGDGILSLYDLYQLKLPAELITLSGCATGLSVVADGDELLGLVRGLIYAGTQSALLTLWDVQDVSTAQFMTSFYGHLAKSTDKAAALRQAALDLRKIYPHPYYWAPFVLLGKVISR
jgi:CHAT domain-containing protein/predicted negative regulator of RcsB-dependent stress response